MFFSPRISTKQLAQLCHRLGLSLEAGIDLRTILRREAERSQGALRSRLQSISDDIDQGASISEAIANTHGYFPVLMRELVRVGEETGHIDSIFMQLAEHYREQLDLRRKFLGSISIPVFQLVIALAVIGGLIWVMGILREITGNKSLDLLGFGLVGESGLMTYLTFLGLAAVGIALAIRAIGRGAIWIRPVQYFVMRLPGVGGALRTLALARLTWSMHLTMNAGMEIRRALRLSLQSTHNISFTDHIETIDDAILAGDSLHEAFAATPGYPPEFLDSLAAAEESGRIVETMAVLSRQYQERAKDAIAILTKIAGGVVWAVIACMIIFMIFRIAQTAYIEPLNEAVRQAGGGR